MQYNIISYIIQFLFYHVAQLNGSGKGVVGVVEVDFLEPVHNKQDFNKTDKYK